MPFTLGRQRVTKAEIWGTLDKMYKATPDDILDLDTGPILVLAIQTSFDMIYECLEYAKKNEPKHRLARKRHGPYEKKRPPEKEL